jgi:membrane-bound serine protease (ClpP class)
MDLLAFFSSVPSYAIILFAVGVILLIVEMSIPGFGVAGISSLVAFALAIIFAADTFLEGLVATGITLLVIGIIVVVFLVLLSKGKLSANFILKAQNSGAEGFTSAKRDYSFLVGREGVAQTILRPAGRMLIGGKVYDVTSAGDFIPAGTPVEVTEVAGSHITVTAKL